MTTIKREDLGKRIKRVREARHLTLKAIEGAAGISATHVSEIERGKTSPTLGALLRIARALGKDPAYFFESEELGDVSRVTSDDRVRESLPGGAGTIDRLTTAIPGGRLQAAYIMLAPRGQRHGAAHAHAGDESALVLEGTVAFTVGEETHRLSHGDSIHFASGTPHTYSNASQTESATLIWVSSMRGQE
jgi:transcriptional regulator with XRE-family HTH domain